MKTVSVTANVIFRSLTGIYYITAGKKIVANP